MNILIVSAMFPPIRTGTSFYSKNIANTLHNLSHKVVVVTVENKDFANEEYPFKLYRLKALHINSQNYFKHLRFSSIFISNYIKISKIAKEEKIDCVLLVNHYLDIAFPAIFAAKKIKKPLYISVGTQMQSLNPFKNSILRTMDRLICGRLIFPFCKNIISWDIEIERYIKEVQRKKIFEKSVIIPFGVNGNIDNFNNYKHDYSAHNQIIGIGAIISQRDYLFNLKVFKELLFDFPNLRLKIIGHIYIDSPIILANELQIADKVEFSGEIPHDKVIEELKKSSLHWMMLSGQYVGLGTATIEAMLLGIPSISNVPHNLLGEPLLIDMFNYIYTDGKNVIETKEKIKKILLNDTERRKIGDNGREFVKNNLNWDKVGKKMIKLFNNSNIN